jgi:hypothetical protein
VSGWGTTVVDRTLVVLARRPLTVAEIGDLDRAFLAAVKASGPVAYLHVSESTERPPPETRTAVMQRLNRHIESGSCLGAALVVTREGFAGAALRALFTSVIAAARPAAPIKIFGRVDDAAAWLPTVLASTKGAAPTATALVAAVAALRVATTGD